ncbi:hypothetical protein AB0E01_39605 [Nocardia vinacea]|uniref:hypothetical protein n=1 Tax=Nocardia vinacea TaxID=96468 RepID=UPI0033D87469
MNTARPTRNTMACIAEISVDGDAATPMVCLLADDGVVKIPMAWDDPPVEDGVVHIVHIAFPPKPDRTPFVLGDARMWRPDSGAIAIPPDSADARVLVTPAVPRSVRRAAAVSVPRMPTRLERTSVVLGAAVLLIGFVVARLTIHVIEGMSGSSRSEAVRAKSHLSR